MDKIKQARDAILQDLKQRFKSGDKTVLPLDKNDEHRWHKPQNNYFAGAGRIGCPVCRKGELRYSRAAYNGHVLATCSTKGCVVWME